MSNKGMLNCDYYDEIYDNFRVNRPNDYEHSIGYRPRGDHMIRVERDDGLFIDYTFIGGCGEYVHGNQSRAEDITDEYSHNRFADKLRNMMDRRGYTQRALAEATGISQSAISGYLRRNEAYGPHAQKKPINPTTTVVYKLAAALGCEPYELL